MAKRLFAFVLALALIVSLMPNVTIGVTAVDASAPGASEWCNHTSHDGWTEIKEGDPLPTESGKYYLSGNVTLDGGWYPENLDVHLCLNGKDITQTKTGQRVIGVENGTKLYIYDCTATTDADGNYTAGKLTGGTQTIGAGVNVKRGGLLHLYGGKITGNHKAGTNGGGVYLQAATSANKTAGMFNMYGGQICDNSSKNGAGVYVAGGVNESGYTNAVFNMYGGIIGSYNADEANEASSDGGGIYATTYGTVNIQGGKIIGNKANTGGGIWARDGIVVNVANATISGNTATNASALYIQNKVQMTLQDTTVTGNVSTNTDAKGYGSAVHVTGTASALILKGKVTIADNTVGSAAQVILRNSGDTDIEKLLINGMTDGYVEFSVVNKLANVDEASDVMGAGEGQTAKLNGQIVFVDANKKANHIAYDGTSFSYVEGHFHDGQLYTAWTGGDMIDGGHYYLTGNVDISKPVTFAGEVTVCFNGKDIVLNAADQRAFYISKGKTVNLEDCSATTDKDGNYTAGGITAKAGLSMTRTYGGLINVNAGGTLNMAGGKIYGVTNTGTDGSPVYLQAATTTNGKAVFNMTGGEISGNTAKEGGAINMAAAPETNADTTNLSELNIDGGRIINNTATTRSGAIEMLLGKVTIKNAKINGNAAPGNSFGAIYVTGAQSNVIIENTEFKDNSAKTVSTLNVASSAKLTLKNVTITDNTSTGTTYGAVNIANGAATLKLQGTTVIYNNLNSAGAQQNLHLQKDNSTAVVDADVSGLTSGAKVGVSLLKARIDADPAQMYFSTTGMTSNPGYCVSDDDAYKVELDAQSRLALVKNTGTDPEPEPEDHENHKLCNDESCTSHGDAMPFEKWDKTDSLPESGCYYLDVDVTLENNITVAAGTELVLCLNGHTITQTGSGKRVASVSGKLTITDCATAYEGTTYKGGVITGGSNSTGGAVVVNRNGGEFNLYGGRLSGNGSTAASTSAGAVYLQSGRPDKAGGVFNMYGGELYDNKTRTFGGAVTVWGEESASNRNSENPATFNLYGGKIWGNNSGTGGAVYVGRDGVFNMTGGTITDNTAATKAAGVMVEAESTVKLSGDGVISGNTVSGEENNLYLSGTVRMQVGTLSANAQIGVTAATGNRAISSETADQTTCFQSDNDDWQITYKEGALWLTEKPIITDHMHNACNDTACTEHGVVPFEKWTDSTSLPTSGNIYLDTDVTLSGAATVSGQLNLCLNGHTIKQTKAEQRVITVYQDSVLTITDCTDAVGSITGGNSDYGSAIYLNEGAECNLFGGRIIGNTPVTGDDANTGAAIFLRSAAKGGATFNMYGGEISGNGNAYSWGGAVSNGLGNAGKTVYVNIYGGKITGNTADTGGAIRLSNSAVLTIAGGEITDNTATTGGAVYLVNGAELKLEGGKISGNSADQAGGIYTTTANTVTVSGAAVVMDNTVNGKQNNLYLDGDAVITLGDVKTDAKVGISVAKVDRAISTQSDTDYSKNFVGDSAYKPVSYRNKVLYVEGSKDHQHCVCDSTVSACDHTKQVWTAWESATSLPTESGYYYLTEDVQLSAAAAVAANQDIYLCLNGKTVTSAKRHIIISRGTEYSITDCNAAPGGLTGGKNTYGGSMNVTAGATLNLFAGKLYGNTAPESEGGAVYLQAGQVKSGEELPGGVFNMYGGEISGNSARYGGAIRAAGTNVDGIAPAQVNIYGGVISGNKAVATVTVDATTGKETKSGGSGGAIAATSSTVINLLGGKITGNTSDGDGAGIYANAKTKITVKDAKITNNAAGGYGGAIFATSNGTVITMESGEMSGNASNAGGAVMLQTRAFMTMNGGKISGNADQKSGGGGLYVSTNTDFVMNGGEISGNTSADRGAGFYALRSRVQLNGGVISGNKAVNRAGGFVASGAQVEINKITIKGNSSKEGGAAYISRTSSGSGDNIQYYPATVNINEGALITGNKAETNCGGILVANDGVVVTMNGGEISKNEAANGGGVMTWKGSTFVLKGGKITGNKATSSGGGMYISTGSTFQMEGGQVVSNTAKTAGGIYFLRSTGILSGGTIGYNYAKQEVKWSNGKEVKSGGSAGGFYGSGATITLKGTSVSGNKADSNGGGIVLGRASYKQNGVTKYDNVKLNMYGGSVSNNTSDANAGGMLIQSKNTVVNIYGGSFTGNKAKSNAGAIYVSTDTTLNMTGGTITGNHSDKSGGAFYCYKSTANITGGNIHTNTATNSAGMLNASNAPCVVTIKNIKIYGGEAKTAGALVVQSKATLYVENCEIYDNKSTSGQGGAVFVSRLYSNGYFTNCKFFDNSSASMGGAVFCSDFSNSSFKGCEFYGNHSAKQGGALEFYHASTGVVEDCTFTENVADDRGGAVAIRGEVVMKNCLVENNTAKTDGGGIYTDTNTTTGSGIMKGLEMYNCQIKNNTSGGQGGGFYIFKGCRVELYDTEITGNKAAAEGGAIWAYEDLELHGTTITGNTSGGEGYAVYMNDAAYDGHSYFTSRNKLSGNVIIKDNEGGDLWMGPDVVFAITADGLGSDTHIEVTLDSGVVTNRILGAYHYEGGDQVYTITSGDRSITDPEYDASLVKNADEEAKTATGDVLLYVGIGIFALAVIAVVILLIAKKKKAGNTAEEVTKE